MDEICPWDVLCCLHIPGSPRRAKLGGDAVADEEATKSAHRFPWMVLAASPSRTAPLSSQPYLTQGFAPSTLAARCRICPRCGRIGPSYSAGQAGDNERDASPSTCISFPAWTQKHVPRRRRRADQASGLCGKDLGKQSFYVTWVWLYCSVGWLLGFDFSLLLLSFPRPFPFIFPPAIRNLFFFVSAAGHLVSHMDGVILEESPRESLLKPPFVLGVEKSIVVHEKDLDKIRTVSIQDCLISP